MTAKKLNPFFISVAILTIVANVFILYATVFDQIISQNQGYFYAGMFGFILLLVFLLFNLFTKLIATSAQKQENSFWRITTIVLLIVFAVLFIFNRVKFTLGVTPNETTIYKSAISMIDKLYAQNPDLVNNELINPSQYVYSLLLSIIFRIVDPSTTSYIITNSILYVACGYLVFRITKKFSDNMCALFAALLMAFMPCQAFAAYSYNAEPIFSLLFLINVDLYTSLYSFNNESSKQSVAAYTALTCIFSGLLLFCEPVSFLIILFWVIAAYILKKDKAINILIAFAISLVIFVALSFGKSIYSGVDFGNVINSTIENFNFFKDSKNNQLDDFSTVYTGFAKNIAVQEENISNNYYYLTTSHNTPAYTDIRASWIIVANQLLYMFLIMMSCSCVIIAIKEKFEKIVPICIAMIGTVFTIFFQHGREVNKYTFICLFIIICGISIHYLYLNHHPEQRITVNALDALSKTGRTHNDTKVKEVEAKDAISDAEFIKRARALIFIGNDDDLYQQIKAEEHANSLRREGRISAIEDTFDDYDEDFFLDKEDDETPAKDMSNTVLNPAQTSSNREPVIPAWKQRPEKIGTDDMFFDDDDENIVKKVPDIVGMTESAPEPVVEVISRNKPETINYDLVDSPPTTSVIESPNKKIKSVAIPTVEKKSKIKQEKIKPEKIKHEKVKPDKKAKKDKKTENEAQIPLKGNRSVAKSVPTVTSTGKTIRRVKNVGAGNVENSDEVAKYLASRESRPAAKPVNVVDEIPNPLPVPAKKEHKQMDYDKKNVERSGWDYDYDIDDDSDWDV